LILYFRQLINTKRHYIKLISLNCLVIDSAILHLV